MQDSIKYLCLDDDPGTDNLLRVMREFGLEIDLVYPKTETVQFNELKTRPYDGLLIDFVLEDHENDGHRAEYSSNLPARFVRDIGIKTDDRDVPIAIWSGNNKLRQYYRPDLIAQGLYDAQYDKGAVADDTEAIVKQLSDLATSYKSLRSLRKEGRSGFNRMLGLTDEEAHDLLDSRVGMRFFGPDGSDFPAHEYARFIETSMLNQPGPLVAEDVLAARLGIDVEKSGESWMSLVRCFSHAAYAGALGRGWRRWWWPRIESWWVKAVSETKLRRLSASERVKLIAHKTGIQGLESSSPISEAYSTKFWTVCDVLGVPLDPVDGFLSNKASVDPWNDPRYISLKALVEREGESEGIGVHASDANRLKLTIESASSE